MPFTASITQKDGAGTAAAHLVDGLVIDLPDASETIEREAQKLFGRLGILPRDPVPTSHFHASSAPLVASVQAGPVSFVQ